MSKIPEIELILDTETGLISRGYETPLKEQQKMKTFWIVCAFFLFVTVSAEWETVDCTEKSVVKAINVWFRKVGYQQYAETKIKETLPASTTYHVDHAIKCKKETIDATTYYGLSIHGLDTTLKYYVQTLVSCLMQVHNVVAHATLTGDYVLDSRVLVASKSVSESQKYPWEGTLY